MRGDYAAMTIKPQTTKTKRKAPDWERIELDYRAGVKTLRQIADEHGISHGAINKRAKKDGWERDLSAKIKAKADSLVSKDQVSREVSKETAISEKEVIDANAKAIADVRIGHRKDISRSRNIVMNLLDELEAETGLENVELLRQLGELMLKPDDKGYDKLNELYHKVISLPGRAKTTKDLVEALRVLVNLERQAYGLDDADADGRTTTKTMTDAERAVRLLKILKSSHYGLSGIAGTPE